MDRRIRSTLVALGVCLATSGSVVAQSPSPALPAAIVWPSPVAAPDGIVLSVLPFGDGLVATGQEQDGVTTRAAAWWSADGASWERTFRQGRRGGYTAIQDVVVTPTGLVGTGPAGVERCTGEGEGAVRCEPTAIAAWRSTDGHAWERVALHGSVGRGAVTGLGAGPLGLLAVGVDQDGTATSWRSPDGLTWTKASLVGDGFDRASVNDVAATDAGWVIVGSTGGRETAPGGVGEPNGSRGAAWKSTDGVTWQPGSVEGEGEQVELRELFTGADGLAAVGTLTGGQEGWVWASADGTDWSLQPRGDVILFPQASDGRTIVGSSYGDEGVLDWWASRDGASWTRLASTGDVDAAPRWDGGVAPYTIGLANDQLIVTGDPGEPAPLWLAPLVPSLQPTQSMGPDRSTPGATLLGYLEALVAGDCDAAAAFVAPTFVIGTGELCGNALVHSYDVGGDPARPSVSEAVYATTLVISGGDASLEDGPMTWFYDLAQQPDGQWLITGGGSGP